MKQLTLLGLDPIPGPEAAAPSDVEDAEPDTSAPPAVVDERQVALFEDRVVLLREIDGALEEGAFGDALHALRTLEETYGPPPADGPPALCLESLVSLSWDDPGKALDTWVAIQPALRPGLRPRILAGLFARLLQHHTPVALARLRPDCLPALASFLAASPGRPEGEGRREARRLVRDALLAGQALESLDFRDDESVADMLAEDMTPPWLACLGVIRRLWPAPPLSPDDHDLACATSPKTSEDAALAFWRCLRITETPMCEEALLHEARRRMKALHPHLHAAFMRRAPVRTAS